MDTADGAAIAATLVDQVRAERATKRDEVLKGLDGLEEKPESAEVEAKPEEKPPEAKTEPEKSEEVETEKEKEAKDEEKDPGLAKRLETIRRADRRHKETLAQRDKEFEEKWGPSIREAQTFKEKVLPKLSRDPIGALLESGHLKKDPAALETYARRLYAMSKGASDPKLAAEADRYAQEADRDARIAEAERRAQAAEERVRQHQIEQKIGTLIASAIASADDETPVVKALVRDDPDEAHALMREVGDYLTERDGEIPTARKIAQALEKVERAKLKKRGIDPDKLFSKEPPKNQTQPAGEKRTAKTLGTDLGTTTPPRHEAMSREARRAKILADLEKGIPETP